MNIEWKKKLVPFESGETGYRNGIWLFDFSWDSLTWDNPNRWKLRTRLPGIRNNLGNFSSPDEAKAYAENVFLLFVEKMKLKAQLN